MSLVALADLDLGDHDVRGLLGEAAGYECRRCGRHADTPDEFAGLACRGGRP